MAPDVPPDWDRRLLVVGERPGQHEDGVSGRPFTGPSGQLLRELLARAGAGSCAFTTAVRCGGPDDATPTMAQIRACRPVLLRTLAELRPRAVLLVGQAALRSALDRGDVQVATHRGRNLLPEAFHFGK